MSRRERKNILFSFGNFMQAILQEKDSERMGKRQKQIEARGWRARSIYMF